MVVIVSIAKWDHLSHLALSPQAFNQGPGPGPGLSHSPNVGPRALQKGLGPDPSLLNLKILEKLTESLFVLFASCQCLVSSTWRRTHNKHSQNFFKNFKDWYFISAKNFKEMVKTKNDQHKILDNFYVECFHIENIMSYISMGRARSSEALQNSKMGL